MAAADAAEAARAAARNSYGKLVAFLSARSRDIAAAEDALSEAFAAALAEWPVRGVPANPQAWLLTVARRRQIDAWRARSREAAAAEQLLSLQDEPVADHADIPDERLRLMFACAHPAIEAPVRAPLMLQTVLGLDAAAIASAFLVSPTTMAQRLVRAKARIRNAGIPFEVRGPAGLANRMDAVLAAIYAAYAEGWCDSGGSDPARRNLAEEAIWLARVAAALLPEEPEVLGLLSLMLHAHARRHARRDADGAYVPLARQDVRRWDLAAIEEAEALLHRASRAGRAGRYQLEAALQSAHNARHRGQRADPADIVLLYDALHALTRSPVAALNLAVARADCDGVDIALAHLDALAQAPGLADYQPYWAARGHLLARAGQAAKARLAFDRAIGLERDPAVRVFLQRRAAALGD
jgi:RNA polymerase sigma-70 factor (ECF subfamily)